MFVYMQAYVEIMLVAILIVALFNGPISGIREFANSVLGKALLVCLIIVVSHQFGTNAGLLMAGITIVLLNNNIEGFEGKEGVALLNCGENGEDCSDATLSSAGVAANAKNVGSQSGKKEEDQKPDAKFTAEERGGKLNAKKRRRKMISKKLENPVEKPGKVVAPERPAERPAERPKEDERKKEDENKKEEENKKAGKKRFESFSN